MSAEYRHRLRVRFRECDMQGHVFFAEYPAFLDVAITELWRERAGGWQSMVADGFDMVVSGLEVAYRGSARFDEEIEIVVSPGRAGQTSLSFDWRVERDGDVLVTGTIRYVCVDATTFEKRPVPDPVRVALT